MKRKEESANQKVQGIMGTSLKQFCNNICKVLEVPTVVLDIECVSSNNSKVSYDMLLKDYLHKVFKQAQNGVT